jgi:hypothetical protein
MSAVNFLGQAEGPLWTLTRSAEQIAADPQDATAGLAVDRVVKILPGDHVGIFDLEI